jgi:hypothetical protein
MNRRAGYAALGVLLLGAALRLQNVDNLRSRTPDERVYTAYAVAILDHGVAGIRTASADYIKDTQRLYPLPTRVGYTAPLAAAMKLAGSRDPRVGSWLSALASILGIAVAIAIGWRFIHPWAGVLGGLLLAVFPADLALARRAWTDSPLTLLGLIMLFCALSIATGPRERDRWAGPVLILTGSIALLLKEGAVAIYGMCGLLAVIGLVRRKLVRHAIVLSAGAAAGILLVLAVWTWVAGGWSEVVNIMAGVSAANASNQYAIDYATGPGYKILAGLWKISPAVAALSAAGLVLALRRKVPALTGLAAFTLLFGALPMVLAHWLNLRYISIVFAPLCLFAAFAAIEGVRYARRRLPELDFHAAAAAVAVALLLISIGDYQRFRHVWVENDVPDLTVRMILEN